MSGFYLRKVTVTIIRHFKELWEINKIRSYTEYVININILGQSTR